MAGSMNIPLDLTKIIDVKYKDDNLRRFLVDLSSRVLQLEEELIVVKQRLTVGSL